MDRITDCPDMTLAVDHGHKALTQPTETYMYPLLGQLVKEMLVWLRVTNAPLKLGIKLFKDFYSCKNDNLDVKL